MSAQPLRAFHGDAAIKAKYLARVRAHAADHIALRLLREGKIRAYPASGNVWSTRSRKLLGCKNQRGYLVSTLHSGEQRQQAKLHRVVWIAAHGLIPADLVIDHINGVKDDNRIANLRIVDNATNVRHRRSYVGASNPSARLTLPQVAAIRRLHPVSKSLVAQIVRGEVWA